MGSMKGDKSTSIQIPKEIEDQLWPYLRETLGRNRSFADQAWAQMMPTQPLGPGSAPATGGGMTPTTGGGGMASVVSDSYKPQNQR